MPHIPEITNVISATPDEQQSRKVVLQSITRSTEKYDPWMTIAQAPLQRAEIDHTLLDLMIVDDQTGIPLGRPSITACIDCYSRCILGFYIGFNRPSYRSVMACLKDCFLPKVNFKRDYPGIVNEWSAYGVMRSLVVDGGLEFRSTTLERVCLSLDITLTAAPRRAAWFKGRIERFLTLNRAVGLGVPGTTSSNIIEKCEHNPAKHPVMTLSTLNKVVRMWIADVYHQQFQRLLQTTPVNMWTSSIKPKDIRLPDETVQLDIVTSRVESRFLTHKGIEFEGLFYNSPELTELRREEGPKLTVEIRINENDIGSIYVVSPKTRKVYIVPSLHREYASGISLWRHKALRKRARENYLKAKSDFYRQLDEDLKLKGKRTHDCIFRCRETSEQTPPRAQPTEAPTMRTQTLTTAASERRTVDQPFPIEDQPDPPLQESAVPITGPQFDAEIGGIHEDQ